MSIQDLTPLAPRVSFAALVAEMMREDLALARRDALVKDAGFRTPDRHE